MLLAVDIGNTNIKMALFKGKRLLRTFRLVTNKDSTVKNYSRLLKRLFTKQKIKGAKIDEIIICSVVPRLAWVLKKALYRLLNKKALILGEDLVASIKNLYKKPKQVGQDRLANAVAAVNKYGTPAVVVDFGTALTFDLVSAKGAYLGGIIVPGIEASLKSLVKNAELLPKISLKKPKAFLGRDTVTSMQSGIVYGYSFLVEGILGQLKKELRQKPHVIATGGCAPLMAHYCQSINKVDNDLTLEGLRLVYKKNRKKS